MRISYSFYLFTFYFMIFSSRREFLFLILAGFFITNTIVAEMIGGKLIQVGSFTFSLGIIPWPVVFLSTDIINEYYGRKGVLRLSMLTAALVIYAFVLLFLGMQVNAAPFSPVQDAEFNLVFGQSMWIITGSITAFIISQLADVSIFWLVRKKTGGKFLWLRTTGSTIVSQLIDSFIVLGIGFLLPGKISLGEFINVGFANYTGKLLIAVALTPLIYLGHNLIDLYLGPQKSKKIVEQTANEVLH